MRKFVLALACLLAATGLRKAVEGVRLSAVAPAYSFNIYILE